jgi:spore coat protein A, manganese oxidase
MWSRWSRPPGRRCGRSGSRAGDQFQVLRRGSGGPGAFDGGWKDTVDLRPAEIVDVAVRFTEHTGRFVFHCHNLEHEDMAMMATIRTV